MDLAESRFWSKVERGDGYWIWTAGKSSHGYGNFWLNGKTVAAHRFAFERACGPIPEGMELLHSCDRRACVRPDHLSIGTALDNARDAVAKGRQARGVRIRNTAKLSEVQVVELRRLYRSGLANQYELAERFGCTQANVSLIVRGESRRQAGLGE